MILLGTFSRRLCRLYLCFRLALLHSVLLLFFLSITCIFMWSVATTRIGLWTWICSVRHSGLEYEVACWFQCRKNSNWCHLTILITQVLLIWKLISLFLRKNQGAGIVREATKVDMQSYWSFNCCLSRTLGSSIRSNGWSVYFYAVEVGALDFCADWVRSSLHSLGFNNKLCRKTLLTLCSVSLRCSFEIRLCWNSKSWSLPHPISMSNSEPMLKKSSH